MMINPARIYVGESSVKFMSLPTDNETWILEAGDAAIQKKASEGTESLSAVERLIYCLWVADYGIRNAGDLEAAHDIYADFQTEGARLARELGLQATQRAFDLPSTEFQHVFPGSFEEMCDEIQQHV